jgi:hypothetical protein
MLNQLVSVTIVYPRNVINALFIFYTINNVLIFSNFMLYQNVKFY